MKYVNQLEHGDWLYVTRTDLEGAAKDKGRDTTIRRSGCGLCSAIMVADRLVPESTFGLKEALKISYDVKANHSIGTDYQRYVPAFAEECGLYYEMSNDTERLLYCLRTGGAAILHIKGDREGHVGVFSHRGHYAVAINEERDGRIAVLDPSYKEGKYEEEGRKGLVEVKKGVIALCDVKVIEEDTEPAEYSYYLFWRK